VHGSFQRQQDWFDRFKDEVWSHKITRVSDRQTGLVWHIVDKPREYRDSASGRPLMFDQHRKQQGHSNYSSLYDRSWLEYLKFIWYCIFGVGPGQCLVTTTDQRPLCIRRYRSYNSERLTDFCDWYSDRKEVFVQGTKTNVLGRGGTIFWEYVVIQAVSLTLFIHTFTLLHIYAHI
jgi:hypothetical protein